MTIGEAILLFVAGIGGGLTGSIAGLASLVTYPALLAYGLPAVTANVTNTVALVFSSTGSVWGSWPELRDQRPRVLRLSLAAMVGGALGGLLLLHTSADSFEKVVPWLIAIASAAILLRRRLVVAASETDHSLTHARHDAGHDVGHRAGWGFLVAVAVVGIYGGYFGAGAGVMMLALLLLVTGEPLPSANGVKNAVLGCANGIAAVGFVFFGDVRWAVVAPLGLGLLIGGRIGPIVVRRSPAGPLRIAIAIAGLGLGLKLGIDAYG